MTKYSVQGIAERVHGELIGPGDLQIRGVNQIDAATEWEITFIGTSVYAKRWADSKASAALVNKNIALEPGFGRALVRVEDADLAMAVVLELFAPSLPRPPEGVHGLATIDSTASLGRNVRIGAHVYVGSHTRIGEHCVIHPHVTILDHVTIGPHCVLWPGVVIRERCELGEHCILHANVTIGADGFGYRPEPGGRGVVKIPQIGTVVIGCEVEIGAGTCVDRGKFAATTIGDGSKIDNLCQIAHNCRIGRCCLIAGQVGLGGSVTLGDGVVMGGRASARDHVTIGDGTMIAGQAGVVKDVPSGARLAGLPAQDARSDHKQNYAMKKLPDLINTVRQLEKRLKQDSSQ